MVHFYIWMVCISFSKSYIKKRNRNAYERAKTLTQKECLTEKPRQQLQERVNFISTFNNSHKQIHGIFKKHWHILQSDPFLKPLLHKFPQITYKKNNNNLAPSRLRQHLEKEATEKTEKGVYKCLRPKCLC